MNRRGFMQMLRRILGFGGGMLMIAGLPFGLARILAPSVSAAPHKRLRPPGALKDDPMPSGKFLIINVLFCPMSIWEPPG